MTAGVHTNSETSDKGGPEVKAGKEESPDGASPLLLKSFWAQLCRDPAVGVRNAEEA